MRESIRRIECEIISLGAPPPKLSQIIAFKLISSGEEDEKNSIANEKSFVFRYF